MQDAGRPATALPICCQSLTSFWPAVASTAQCDPATGRIGALVAVPSDDESAEVAFRIETAIGPHPPDCSVEKNSVDCIVSRRVLGYLDHEKLLVPVVQREVCRGEPCDFDTTCVLGECVSARIASALCADAAGCGEDELPTGGAGGAGGAPADPDALVYDWAKDFGSENGADTGVSVAIAPNGTIYLAAEIATDGYSFSGGMATASDLVIPTFDSTGQYLAEYSTISGDTTVRALAIDEAGHAYFAGNTRVQGGDYGDGLIGGESDEDILVGSSDADGGYRWARAYGNEVFPEASHKTTDVAVGPDGHVYVAGVVGESEVIVEEVTVPEGSLWVASYLSDGTSRWVRHFAGLTSGGRLAFDGGGNLYVAGHFSGALELGELSSAGGNDVYVAKFDGGGNAIWATRFGNGDGDQEGIDVAVGVDGTVYLAGTTNVPVDFGGELLDLFGDNHDAFVLAINADGNHVWSRSIGMATEDAARAIATSGAGNVFVASSTPIASIKQLKSMTADGSDRWDIPIAPTEGTLLLNDLAVGPQGELLVTGAFQGSIAFGDDLLESPPDDTQGFLVRYAGQ